MGYTHYHYYKNPVVELAKLMDKKADIHRNTNSWMEAKLALEKLPTHDSLVKKIEKQIKAFKEIKSDLEHVLPCLQKDKGFKLRGGNGEGEPLITDTTINFNGDASSGNSFETFHVNIFEHTTFYRFNDLDEKGEMFGFCKTARRPYDIAVCVSLMVIKHHLGSGFRISSDGGFEEWSEAIEYYEYYFKRKAPKQLVNYLKKEEAVS